MSWKHTILAPYIISLALMAALTVTPEEVQQKVAAMAKEIELARFQFIFTMSQSWFGALHQAETTKMNLTDQLEYYYSTFLQVLQDSNGTVILDDASLDCFQYVMSDFNTYKDAILNNIDTLLLNINVSLTGISTIYDQAANEVNELSETINSCEDTNCAEELDEALSQLDSNVTYSLTAEEIKLQELWYEISNTNISDVYIANLNELKEKTVSCVTP